MLWGGCWRLHAACTQCATVGATVGATAAAVPAPTAAAAAMCQTLMHFN